MRFIYELIDGKDSLVITGCENIEKELVIPSEAEFEGEKHIVEEIGTQAFRKRPEISSIFIPDTVKQISKGAFFCCTYLSEITLPRQITRISPFTFAGCELLEEVYIPDEVVRIEEASFSKCVSLRRVRLPESLSFISDDAFFGCSVREFIVPDGQVDFYKSKCQAWGLLKTNCIPETSMAKCEVKDGIGIVSHGASIIPHHAFFGNNEIVAITIPDTIVTIEHDAFCGCPNLKTVEIPNSVQFIGDSAFYSCDSLETIVIPDSVVEIEEDAFGDCGNLKTIKIGKPALLDKDKIPDGVQIIPNS